MARDTFEEFEAWWELAHGPGGEWPASRERLKEILRVAFFAGAALYPLKAAQERMRDHAAPAPRAPSGGETP
jgi:hypothetical protein